MRHIRFGRILAMLLVCAIVLGIGASAMAEAAEEPTPQLITFEKLDGVSADLVRGQQVETAQREAPYAETDVVRVIITVEGLSVIEKMKQEGRSLTTKDLTTSPAAVSYQNQLLAGQETMAARISRNALGGKELDVVWNLTLAANAMSANVPYGAVKNIEKVDGVKSVVLAKRYEPAEAQVTNIVAKNMTGVNAVQQSEDYGYTGAGMRIAIIDTGTDTDHQSFDNDSFLFALGEEAGAKGLSYSQYAEELDLLDAEEVAAVLPKLHAYKMYGRSLTAEDLYYNEKLPFNFNYVDVNLNVTHDLDTAGEHGSHVAGIAAANSYLPVGDDLSYDFTGDGILEKRDATALMEYIINGTPYANKSAVADVDGDGAETTHDVAVLLAGKKASAVDTVGVEGVAPNAQLITMKVFGKNGGAYSDDYCAAMEDAVMLGCDVANLSLGGNYNGFTYVDDEDPTISEFVNGVMDSLSETNMVVAIAAGNNGNWADNDMAYGFMYADEAGTGNVSSPATYPNALAVASADNMGLVSALKTEFSKPSDETQTVEVNPTDGAVYDEKGEVDLTENYWADLAGEEGKTYDVVFVGDPTNLLGSGTGEIDNAIYGGTEDAYGSDKTIYKDKIVMVARGGSQDLNNNNKIDDDEHFTFTQKHMNAAAAGAKAVIIYNNAAGTVAPSLAGSTSRIPCVSITLDEAKAVFALAEKDSSNLFSAKVTVTSGLYVDEGDETAPMTMSDFSSWGSNGALAIKPEITAPGGNIYSVNGLDPDGDAYELMSGTSMATPHIAGLTALAIQYIEENGLAEKTGLSPRVLAQSLMMSTAVPMIEEVDRDYDPVEYSVRNQGAGLANLENIVKAESYIMMENTPDGADGKVKAELGDGTEPYTVTFRVNNLTGTAQTYTLESSILTTAAYPYYDEDENVVGYLTADEMQTLAADVAYEGSGVSDGTLTVPANGSVEVTATITVDAAAAENLMTNSGFTNGFYVEGYLYLTAAGETAVSHSIPLLGWYGNWSDPSMYDKGDYIDYFFRYGVENDELVLDYPDTPSHLDYGHYGQDFSGNMSFAWLENVFSFCPQGGTQGFYYSGNVYNDLLDHEDEYIEARNAINTTDDRAWEFYAIFPSLIRNAGAVRVRAYNPETGEVYHEMMAEDAAIPGSFYYPNAQQWLDVTTEFGMGFDENDPWDYTDAQGNPLEEGTPITFELTMAPEFYRTEDAQGNVSYAWDKLGKGVSLSWNFTVDNTAPDLAGEADLADGVEALELSDDGSTLTCRVKDNRYVAAVVLLDGAGNKALSYQYPNQAENAAGTVAEVTFDLSKVADKKVSIGICDYAGNETYYAVNRGGEGASLGKFLGFQFDIETGVYHNWVAFDENVSKNETAVFSSTGMEFACAEYVNGWVFAQAADGVLYAIPADDFTSSKREPTMIRLAKLGNVYQDLAYNYKDGQLYGLFNDVYDDYSTATINAINFTAGVDDYGEPLPAFSEAEAIVQRGGLSGVGLACDDAGTLYILGDYTDPFAEEDTPSEGEETTPAGKPMTLWKVEMEEDQWSATGYVYGMPTKLTTTPDDIQANYRQAMTWDHNSETLYWASFNVPKLFHDEAFLYKIEAPATDGGAYTFNKVGTLSSETGSLMTVLSAEKAAEAAHTNVPAFDRTEVGTPVLDNTSITLLPGGSQTLAYSMDPWYTQYTDVTWASDDETVCTVDENGVVTAVNSGTATVTVASAQDKTLTAQCTVNVASIDANVQGVINAGSFYDFAVENGVSTMTIDPDKSIDLSTLDDSYGSAIGETTPARGYLYAAECGDTGVIYKVDPATGEAVDWFSPVDGDMMLGLGYSDKLDTFTGIMNFYLYVDIPLADDHAYEEKMLESYDETEHMFMWHRLDFSQYLEESNTDNFVTGETGNGSVGEIVLCGITSIDNTDGTQVEMMGDFMGQGWSENYYTPDTTWVLLDNVGRFWYVDEITGMTYDADMGAFSKGEGESMEMISADLHGLEAVENEDGTYNVFVIRSIEKTAFHDMYVAGTMPQITYAYNDLYHTTAEATLTKTDENTGELVTENITRDVFFVSMNQSFWQEDYTNYLYLYIPGVDTGMTEYDENWNVVPVKSPDLLFALGNTGDGNFTASINSAELLSGVELDVEVAPPDEGGWYALDWSAAGQQLSDVYRAGR